MSDDWIRIDVGLPDHRKTAKLIKRLGMAAFGHLVFLWARLARVRPTGILTDYDESDIALDARWTDEADEFCRVLYEVGFMDQLGEDGTTLRKMSDHEEWRKGLVYVMHDWEDWQPWIASAPERKKVMSEKSRRRWDKVKGSRPPKEEKKQARSATPSNEQAKQEETPKPDPYRQPRKDHEGPVKVTDRKMEEQLTRMGIPVIRENWKKEEGDHGEEDETP